MTSLYSQETLGNRKIFHQYHEDDNWNKRSRHTSRTVVNNKQKKNTRKKKNYDQ